MGRNCIRVCVSFCCFFLILFFSLQKQVPQRLIGMGRVIYYNKAHPAVIRTPLKVFKKISSDEKNRFEIFDFSSIMSE